jgi:hypothetical protein
MSRIMVLRREIIAAEKKLGVERELRDISVRD